MHYRRQRIDGLNRAELLPYRKKMQMIYQNPYASLNPRKTAAATQLEAGAHASEMCAEVVPELRATSGGVRVACHAVAQNRS